LVKALQHANAGDDQLLQTGWCEDSQNQTQILLRHSNMAFKRSKTYNLQEERVMQLHGTSAEK